MKESRKIVIRETAVLAFGESVCVSLMFGAYTLAGKFNLSVLLSGLVGLLLVTANFFSLAVAATLAADMAENQDPEGGKKLIKAAYPIRLLVLAVTLILLAGSGYFDVLALAVPLLLAGPILTLTAFFRKAGESRWNWK